jgi:hypothetical protein
MMFQRNVADLYIIDQLRHQQFPRMISAENRIQLSVGITDA